METMIFFGLELFSSHRPASHCYTYRTFSIMVGVSARACVLLPWLLRPVGGACLLAEAPFERNRTRELSQTIARIIWTPFIPILLELAASMKTHDATGASLLAYSPSRDHWCMHWPWSSAVMNWQTVDIGRLGHLYRYPKAFLVNGTLRAARPVIQTPACKRALILSRTFRDRPIKI